MKNWTCLLSVYICLRETCSNENLPAFEQEPTHIWTTTFTHLNDDQHAFKRGSTRIRTRTFTRSNEGLHVFNRQLNVFVSHVECVCVIRCVSRVLYIVSWAGWQKWALYCTRSSPPCVNRFGAHSCRKDCLLVMSLTTIMHLGMMLRLSSQTVLEAFRSRY